MFIVREMILQKMVKIYLGSNAATYIRNTNWHQANYSLLNSTARPAGKASVRSFVRDIVEDPVRADFLFIQQSLIHQVRSLIPLRAGHSRRSRRIFW